MRAIPHVATGTRATPGRRRRPSERGESSRTATPARYPLPRRCRRAEGRARPRQTHDLARWEMRHGAASRSSPPRRKSDRGMAERWRRRRPIEADSWDVVSPVAPPIADLFQHRSRSAHVTQSPGSSRQARARVRARRCRGQCPQAPTARFLAPTAPATRQFRRTTDAADSRTDECTFVNHRWTAGANHAGRRAVVFSQRPVRLPHEARAAQLVDQFFFGQKDLRLAIPR